MAITKGKPVWEGSIAFGLVTIPIRLFSASREPELKLRYVHRTDLAPIRKKAVCELGHNVPWDEIIRAYEPRRGIFVPVLPAELEDQEMAHTQTVDIFEFVDPDYIEPLYFKRPYYTEPQKGGDKAYLLLCDALVRTHTVGIARVVLRNRTHLACVLPRANMLVVELMYYEEDLKDPKVFRTPARKAVITAQERKMADEVINRLSSVFDPEKYIHTYKKEFLETVHLKSKQMEKQYSQKQKREKMKVKKLQFALHESIKLSENSKR